MDSRINFQGFPIQDIDFQFMGCPAPATPEKPITTRSNSVATGRHGSQFSRMDLQVLAGYSGGCSQMLNCDREAPFFQMGGTGNNVAENAINPAAYPNKQVMYDVMATKANGAAPTANPFTFLGSEVSIPGGPLMPNMHSQVSNWRECSFRQPWHSDQIHCTSSKLLDSYNSSSQTAQYGFPVPYHACYNLTSPPRGEADAASSATTSFQFTLITPDQTKKLENMVFATVGLLPEKSTLEEKDKPEDLLTSKEKEASEHNIDEHFHTVLNSSSAVISTTFQEQKDPDRGSDQVVDLNKTPQQKPPKRKKHRPKVIAESKPKRTPNATTPKNTDSKEKPTGKRKYVRKKGLQESATQQTDAIGVGEAISPSTGKRKYVRKKGLQVSATQHTNSIGEATNLSIGKRKYVHKSLEEPAIQDEDSVGDTPNRSAGKKYALKKTPAEPTIQHEDPARVTTSNSAGKRKYVSNKGLDQGATQYAGSNGVTAYSSTAKKSCRRALNFESDNIREEMQETVAAEQEEMPEKKKAFNLNVGFEVAETCSGANKLYKTKSVSVISQQDHSLLENQQLIAMSTLTTSMNQVNYDHMPVSESRITAAQLESLKVIQMVDLRGSTINTNRGMQQHIHTEANHAKPNCESHERTRQMTSQFDPQSAAKMPIFLLESRGLKRGYTEHCNANQAGTPLLCQVEGSNLNSNILTAGCSETQKREKIGDGTQGDACEKLFDEAIEGLSSKSNWGNDFKAAASAFQRSYELVNTRFESNNVNNRENTGINRLAGKWCLPMVASGNDLSEPYLQMVASGHNLSRQHLTLEPDPGTEMMEQTNGSTQVRNLVLTSTKTHGMPPANHPKSGPAPENWLQPKIGSTKTPRKQQIIGYTLPKSVKPGKVRVPQEQKDVSKDHSPTAKRRGQPSEQKFTDPIEEIISHMEELSLNNEQNALVPYQRDGAVVPYEGFTLIKKHKPRPKVDLDPETDRVWKLLMGKEGSEGLEGTSNEKEQWWKNEREVFRLRVNSFIARMHMVQGDRRFSKWKGSVVDSVIGVFLTQNVSDHLSSSAFMSLASLFPPKSKRNSTFDRNGTSIIIEEPHDRIPNPNDIVKTCEKLNFPLSNQNSLVEGLGYSMEEEVLSSQDSFGSSIIQTNGAGSNSEADDPATGCRPNKSHNFSFTDLLMGPACFEECCSPVSGSSLLHEVSRVGQELSEDTENANHRSQCQSSNFVDYPYTFNHPIKYNNPKMQEPVVPSSTSMLHSFGLYGEECISSWSSTASILIKEKEASCTSKRVSQWTENAGKTIAEQHRELRSQEIPLVNPHPHSTRAQCNFFPYCKSQAGEENKNFQPESAPALEYVNHAEALATTQNSYGQTISNIPMPSRKVFGIEERITSMDKQIQFSDELVEQNPNEQENSTNTKKSRASASTIEARKGKAESKKKDAINWDGLRKQVQEKKGKERSEDTMDSLDYEALRSASVKKISEAIKERGMNNMLAERIKEFLDRIIREHGSIDLEWLREVPPDKAKEYLLSIRGLGLKSVECVRLLTLHHLAFPVDTNVGRIAVRLGWVPLQPLPESLQLHLLELYPILETIQKYLWPRLCKLDQRTLYELHYQMITFGKVFCTKSRPNCNACPLRAECRHFASAFASARLALPGPEEKSMTTSTVPFSAERNPGIVINPMPLPSTDNNCLKEVGSYICSCIPIVEEPATPDHEHAEVTESDIEDAFNDDPNEIPTIYLNMEEFTLNLQNYMQGSMEIQEGDMTKALVALSPNAASIPTPKLKNVSRLRTEHQVYELPDSHPLLKRMDRRELDDPSPYLLAIWAPGETANSIEPPEQLCQSQEPSKLCNDKTCFSCNSVREANSQTVRGTILIPCRTANRGSFPLNGTYFQVNEVFADHESSLNPIDVPRKWIWNLPRRTVYFGTSVTTIFKGLSTEEIQSCFWKGFVCVRGFDIKTRAPRPLKARLHFPASKLAKTKKEKNEMGELMRRDQ